VMATFDTPSGAIRCVQSLRRALRSLGLEIRAGMHAGQIALRDGDISGVAVHIAAHVLDAARDGGVLVSRTVAELVEGSGLELVDQGAHVLKGVPGELNLFLVSCG
jgi:class 3 adenylate cyclase